MLCKPTGMMRLFGCGTASSLDSMSSLLDGEFDNSHIMRNKISAQKLHTMVEDGQIIDAHKSPYYGPRQLHATPEIRHTCNFKRPLLENGLLPEHRQVTDGDPDSEEILEEKSSLRLYGISITVAARKPQDMLMQRFSDSFRDDVPTSLYTARS